MRTITDLIQDMIMTARDSTIDGWLKHRINEWAVELETNLGKTITMTITEEKL